jgi:hypothetical protein
MIVAHIVQGVGTATAAPSTLLLLMANTTPRHRRKQWRGIATRFDKPADQPSRRRGHRQPRPWLA